MACKQRPQLRSDVTHHAMNPWPRKLKKHLSERLVQTPAKQQACTVHVRELVGWRLGAAITMLACADKWQQHAGTV